MLPPAAPGLIWTKDLHRLIQYYDALWEAAMKGRYIVKTSPSNRLSVPVAELIPRCALYGTSPTAGRFDAAVYRQHRQVVRRSLPGGYLERGRH